MNKYASFILKSLFNNSYVLIENILLHVCKLLCLNYVLVNL